MAYPRRMYCKLGPRKMLECINCNKNQRTFIYLKVGKTFAKALKRFWYQRYNVFRRCYWQQKQKSATYWKLSYIWNRDENPVTFDMTGKKTINVKETKCSSQRTRNQ